MGIDTTTPAEQSSQQLSEGRQMISSLTGRGTRALLINFCTACGKSTVAAHVVHQFCPGAIYSIHDSKVNGGTGAFGVRATHVRQNMFPALEGAIREDPNHILVDVSSLSLLPFMEFVERTPSILSHFDVVTIPVTLDYQCELSAMATARWLIRQKLDPHVIRFLYNHYADFHAYPERWDLTHEYRNPFLKKFMKDTLPLGEQAYSFLPRMTLFDLEVMRDQTGNSLSQLPVLQVDKCQYTHESIAQHRSWARRAYWFMLRGLPREHAFPETISCWRDPNRESDP